MLLNFRRAHRTKNKNSEKLTSHRWRRRQRRCRRCGAANKKRLRQRRAPHTHAHTDIHTVCSCGCNRYYCYCYCRTCTLTHTHVQRTRSRDRPRLQLAHSPALSVSLSSPLSSLSVSLLPGPHTFAKKFFDVLFIYFVKHRIRLSSLSRESFAAKLSLSLPVSLSFVCSRALAYTKRNEKQK